MLSLLAAECLLCFFTKPGRAASIAGDLLEESRHRSSLWFWSQVIRTAAGLLARNLVSAPVRVSILISVGCLLELACVAAYGFLHGHILNSAVAAAKANLSVNPFPMFLAIASLWVWHVTHPFLIGLVVARFARGREVALCAAVAAVASAFYLADEQHRLWTDRHDLFWPERLVRISADSLGYALALAAAFILAGMIVAGRRSALEKRG
jgi:hypothetical protein